MSLLELCAMFAVVGSLFTVLVGCVAFALATAIAVRARVRPDPVAASLDRFLAELLGEGAVGGPRPVPGRGVRGR